MLIHAHRRRAKCTHEYGGKRYVFEPNENGDVVAEVKDQAAIDRLLELDHAFTEYVDPAAKPSQAPVAAMTAGGRKRSTEQQPKSAFVISNGTTQIDLGALNDVQLREFIAGQELEIDAELKGDDLRTAVRDALLSGD